MKTSLLFSFLILFTLLSSAQSYNQDCISDTRLNRNDACTNWQTTNYGTSTALQASTWTYVGIGCSQGDIRTLLKFDINPTTSPQALYDNRATLNLFFPTGSAETHSYVGSGTDNQFYVQRVTSNWVENTVTWNTQPTTTTTGQLLVPSSTTNPSTQDYQIDISTIVYDWVCGTTVNNGVRLILLNEGQTYRRVTFASKEHTTPALHPTLTLEYAYIAASAPDTICEGDAFNVNCALNNANNPANYNYQWTHINSSTNYTTQNLVNPTWSLGLNMYVVTVSNPWCQTAKDTVEIFVESQPTADAGNDTSICTGQNVQLTASGGSSYSWSTGGSTSSINVSPATTTTYVVTVSNGNCSATDDVVVTVGSIIANAGNDTSICENDQAFLIATGGGTYLWNNGTTTAANTVTPLVTTTYTVTVNSGGCTASDDVIVTVNPVFNATITAAGPFCSNDLPIMLTAVDPGGTWSGTGVNATTGEFDPSVAGLGTFQIIYTITAICGDADTIDIIVNETPIVSFKADTTEGCQPLLINFTNLSVPAGNTWLWDFGDGNTSTDPNYTTHSYMYSNTYSVSLHLSNTYGCQDSLTQEISCIELIFPNVITPNSDGKNDYFVIVGAEILDKSNLRIYNRWGKIVFEADNYQNDWNGENLADGVYYYIFEYLEKSYSGSLTIFGGAK
jgi:gliding motility-associated-like protein